MSTEPDPEVTALLDNLAAGGEAAKRDLIHGVYQELHAVAARLMQGERQDHSWGATVLVHEAFLKLFARPDASLGLDAVPAAQKRRYFFGVASRVMRQLLIDHARSAAAKRAKDRVPLDAVLDRALAELKTNHGIDMEALDLALREMATFAPEEHEVALLRIFGGLTIEQIAADLGLNNTKVHGYWKWARAWLFTRLGGGRP